MNLHGVVPPIVTPLLEDETLDEAAFERLLGRLLDAGVHGFFILGSTGEQPALRKEVRRDAVACARRAVGGRVPLVAGTMANGTLRAIDNITEAAAAGADAVAVTPCHYYPSSGAADQIAHYRSCAAASPVPVIVYNIPSTTKVMMAADTIAEIAVDPRIHGVKDSSGDFMHFLRLLSHLRGESRVGIMVGSPPLAGAAISYGASGVVPGVSNIDPGCMIQIVEAARRADHETMRALQERVHALMRLLRFGSPLVCIKTALEMMGHCSSRATAPFQPIGSESREILRKELEALDLLAA